MDTAPNTAAAPFRSLAAQRHRWQRGVAPGVPGAERAHCASTGTGRQQQRQARGNREAREANQAPILLGGMKNRSEHSAGRWQAQQLERSAVVDARVRDAAAQLDDATGIALLADGGVSICRT